MTINAKSANQHRTTFSIDDHDKDGDIFEQGLYLHIGPFRISFEDPEDFKAFWVRLQGMQEEIEDNWRHLGRSTVATETPKRPTVDEVLAKVKELLAQAATDWEQAGLDDAVKMQAISDSGAALRSLHRFIEGDKQ